MNASELRKKATECLRNRQCFVCGASIQYGKGVYQAHLRTLTCRGNCNDKTTDADRVFDRSKRGRRLSALEVLRKLAVDAHEV